MKKILAILLSLSITGYTQTHSIDTLNLEMIGTTSFDNISANTYYNTFDSCAVSWSILDISVPNSWQVSFCFPNCYSIGQSSGQEDFVPNQQIYLGCHFYPNDEAGFGFVKLEIITNEIFKDTVTFNGIINPITEINDKILLKDKKVKQIYDVFGRNVFSQKKDQILIFFNDDGSIEKRIIVN